MIHLHIDTLIHRPIGQVFDFISVPENDFQWQYGTLASARISEGVSETGTSFRSIGHLMGRRVESTFEVTEYETNRKYGFKSLSGPVQSNTSYAFELEKGSTRVSMSTQVAMINFIQVNHGVLEINLKKQLKENLTMLKGLLEAERIGVPASKTLSIAR